MTDAAAIRRRPQLDDLPTLELAFQSDGTMAYRWKAVEREFAMPVKVGTGGRWQTIEPTTAWKTMPAPGTRDAVQVATDLYYVNVSTQ